MESPSSARSLIAALAGIEVEPQDPHQAAGAELLRELFGISSPYYDATRGEDEFSRKIGADTSGENRRRPKDLPYNPVPPQPGPFGQFPVMEWHSVDSSNVSRIAYDEESRTIYVEFLTGAIYKYYDMPPSRWADFLASNSKGMYVWYILRRNGTDPGGTYENVRSGQRGGRVTPIYTSAELRRR